MRTAEIVATDRSPSNPDQLRVLLVRHPGFKLEDRGTFHELFWREPGNIFNFKKIHEDKLVIGNGVAATVDICRAEARCLYLTVKGVSATARVDQLWQLLFRHYEPTAA